MEKHAYFIGLLPAQFYTMTIREFEVYFEQTIKKIKRDDESNDRRTARICALLSNINRDKKKKPKPFTEDDFMPKERKKMTNEELVNSMKIITIAFGGEVNI